LACPLPPVCEIAGVISAIAAMARTAAEVRSDFMADLLQSKIWEILEAMPEPCLDAGQIDARNHAAEAG
jgi:hypothetical protein